MDDSIYSFIGLFSGLRSPKEFMMLRLIADQMKKLVALWRAITAHGLGFGVGTKEEAAGGYLTGRVDAEICDVLDTLMALEDVAEDIRIPDDTRYMVSSFVDEPCNVPGLSMRDTAAARRMAMEARTKVSLGLAARNVRVGVRTVEAGGCLSSNFFARFIPTPLSPISPRFHNQRLASVALSRPIVATLGQASYTSESIDVHAESLYTSHGHLSNPIMTLRNPKDAPPAGV
ncbi:hypothetical protein EXIGLDRAFT_828935 [Exidia glandulosa HHB12029]|uniref:Uncharacterized protein n=1 Tax=Exidia glandulosa HHB12029 TaxID=1314781 RepID=A0A165PXK6_EXIGL|nr:hypothetical protein EXIGLDRAFT_828935 [Exidia glandulosa HHB12029]